MKKPWDVSFDQNKIQNSRTLRCRKVDLVGYLKEISKITSLKMDLRVHEIALKSMICFSNSQPKLTLFTIRKKEFLKVSPY